MKQPTLNGSFTPEGTLEVLSPLEVAKLKNLNTNALYELFRQCVLAILNTGSNLDDVQALQDAFPDFRIDIKQEDRGVRLNVFNAPADAFVDGHIIQSTREMVFSALRDILFTESDTSLADMAISDSQRLTDHVFYFLRNANLLRSGVDPKIIVCWGGHSINHIEYKYTKKVGHAFGLRGLDSCTGCGPGAMKGPMKGATIAHAKQRVKNARYIGLTEPGIIAAEAPNPIVNELAILPDIEKRLEAFVRLGHGITIFPGGAGTAEEFLYLLSILLHPSNAHIPLPLLLTGPKESEPYFNQLNLFIEQTLGKEVTQKYDIIIDNPSLVAQRMYAGLREVRKYRKQSNDAFHFNWQLTIEHRLQQPFEPTHQAMSQLQLHKDLSPHILAANLRCAFSGIVAGNVKAKGIAAIKQYGPFKLQGSADIMKPLDQLLRSFVVQGRMKLPGTTYTPCYQLVH